MNFKGFLSQKARTAVLVLHTPRVCDPLKIIMSPMSRTSPDDHQGQLDFGAPARKKGMEHRIAPVLTAAQQTKLWRKIDLRLLPMVTLMYLLCFMDRGVCYTAQFSTPIISYLTCRQYWCERIWVYPQCSTNVLIGNAKLDGLMTQLHLTGNKFNIALVSQASVAIVWNADAYVYRWCSS
jgi:hypothetical protein